MLKSWLSLALSIRILSPDLNLFQGEEPLSRGELEARD